jgi:hypothetical protein
LALHVGREISSNGMDGNWIRREGEMWKNKSRRRRPED